MANQPSQDEQAAKQRSNELEQARLATDPMTALEHLATLLARDPRDSEAATLLEHTLPRVSPQALRERAQANTAFFGLAALEAYAIALAGHFAEAFVRLCGVTRTQPQIPYFSWLDRWFAQNREALGTDTAEVIGAHSVGFIRDLPNLEAAPPTVTQNVQALANVLGKLEARNLGGQRLQFALSLALRRLRRWPEAKAVSRKWFETSPSWFSAVEAGNAHREALDLEAATSFYERAIEIDPTESSARLDLADVLLDRGMFEAAAEIYERLARSEHRSWAEPSAWFARWQATADVSCRDKLLTSAGGPSASNRAQELARYFSYGQWSLPPVFDHSLRPSFDLIARLSATPLHLRPSAPFRINVRSTVPEAPSVGVAFAAAIEQLGVPCELCSSFEHVPEPDPRVPRSSVPFLLWIWDERGARAALEPPSAQVSRAVQDLASSRYDLDAWQARARQLAQDLGPGATRDLLACMVHLTRAPTLDTVTWLRRTQLAAALVLAQLDVSSTEAKHFGALQAALEGPADWTVGAAAVAVAVVARTRDSEARERARKLLERLLNETPANAFWTCEYDVAAALLFILDPALEARRALWRRLRRLERMYGT